MADRGLPANVEAEKALLGSILIDPEALYHAARYVGPDDFYVQRHGMIYRAIQALARRSEPLDYITIIGELSRRDQLEDVGGQGYMSQLFGQVPSGLYAEAYANRVYEAAVRRRMIQAASKVAKIAWQEDEELDTSRSSARLAFEEAMETLVSAEAMGAEEAAQVLFERAGAYAADPLKPGEVRGLSTGIVDLDRMLRGLGAGLYLIGAVQHTGKTAFVQQLAYNVAAQGAGVLMVSMEHAASHMYDRIASSLAGIDVEAVQDGLGQKRLSRYYEALDKIQELPMEIIGRRVKLPQIEAEVRDRQRHGLELVVIDNLELASASIDARMDYVRFRDAAYWLLAIAQENDVAVLATMQAGTKKAEIRPEHRPTISDLYGADGPSQAASVVLLLHRADRWVVGDGPRTGTMEVICWKDKVNYTGTGKARKLAFGAQGQVRDLARSDQEQEPAPLDF